MISAILSGLVTCRKLTKLSSCGSASCSWAHHHHVGSPSGEPARRLPSHHCHELLPLYL